MDRRSVRGRARLSPRAGEEDGFTLIDVVVGMAIMAILIGSLSYVLANGMIDTAYARQRATALQLANQTIEEVRALPFAKVSQGMTSSDLSGDPNVTGSTTAGYCFDGMPLVVAGVQTPSSCPARSLTASWTLPQSCTSPQTLGYLPAAGPLDPHQVCYQVGKADYWVDIYVTLPTAGASSPPVEATAVASWNQPLRAGLQQWVVSSTQISNCAVGEEDCTNAS